MWPIRRAVILTLVGGGMLISAITAVGLILLGFPGIQQQHKIPISTFFDVLKLSFGAVAGMGASVALVMAYRRQRVAEAENRLSEAASRRDDQAAELEQAKETRERTRLFNERFTIASGQLGHDQPAVRLAGIYATAGLADDWPEHRQTCIDVLCAYLRMPYQARPDDDAPQDERVNWHREREVRHTVIRVIAAHLRDGAVVSWQGYDLDFTGVAFDGGDFSKVHFSTGARISFADAEFGDGQIDFTNAQFSGGTVVFIGARFSGGYVTFGGAQFSGGVVMFSANFCGATVNFVGAAFSGRTLEFIASEFSSGIVDFQGARFTGEVIGFGSTKFAGGTINFGNAKFSSGSIHFSGAKFSGAKVMFHQAEFSGGRVDFRDCGRLVCPCTWPTDAGSGADPPSIARAEYLDQG